VSGSSVARWPETARRRAGRRPQVWGQGLTSSWIGARLPGTVLRVIMCLSRPPPGFAVEPAREGCGGRGSFQSVRSRRSNCGGRHGTGYWTTRQRTPGALGGRIRCGGSHWLGCLWGRFATCRHGTRPIRLCSNGDIANANQRHTISRRTSSNYRAASVPRFLP
jgi:hypothetical protein